MSKAEIISMIDADGAGLGSYSAEITVDAQAGNGATIWTCLYKTDAGEDVFTRLNWLYLTMIFVHSLT